MSSNPKPSELPEPSVEDSGSDNVLWSDSKVPIWPEASIPDPKGFNPCTAKAFARLIGDYWHDCRLRNELNSDSILDIIDLAPASGKACWLTLQALQREVGSEFRWRYLPASPDVDWFDQLFKSPGLSSFRDQGLLIPTIWDEEHGSLSVLNQTGTSTWQATNPIVVIGHDRFSYLNQRLLAVHYGKLMEVDFPAASNDTTEAEKSVTTASPRWKIFENTSITTEFSSVFSDYLKKFNSSPIPFPEGGLRFIDAFHKIANFGYFLINFATGYATEQSLRLALFSRLCDELNENKTLPVNFHLLAYRLQELGCSVENIQPQPQEVLQLALGRHNESGVRLKRLASIPSSNRIEHVPSLIEATRALGTAHVLSVRLSLLKLSEFDIDVFLTGDRALTAALANANSDGSLDKATWKEALQRVWLNYLPHATTEKLHQRLAPAAMHCGAWALAKEVLKRGMEFFGEDASDLANLAWCENRTGNAALALELAEQALKIDKANPLVLEVHKRILQRLALRDEQWKCVLLDSESQLVLEPLDKSHAEAFFYQYRDPQIAIMTGLPALKSVEETRRWIEEQEHEAGKVNYAIMLADEGFVGFINLAVSEHAAFFCFWAGVDFQGRALASTAGRVVCKYAEKLGVPIMLTSAFIDNKRSIRSLTRMGFQELSIRALAPDNDRIFFILAESKDLNEINGAKELVEYYSRENLNLKFPPLDNSVDLPSATTLMAESL
jgi:RimJ/RimL family protein N-acetyltransferase